MPPFKPPEIEIPTSGDKLVTGDYFLSPHNPSATSEQLELEDLAMRIIETPQYAEAKQQAADRLRLLAMPNVPEEALIDLETVAADWAFQMTLKAVNADSNYPKMLHHVYGLAHYWFGRQVPASCGFGYNQFEVVYSMFPVDPFSHYELHGKVMNPSVVDGLLEVSGNLSLSMPLGYIDFSTVEFDEEGRFVITLGPEPAHGRRNYLQLKRDARNVLMRSSYSDWNQVMPAMRVRRLDPPTAEPLSFEEVVERAAHFIVDDIPATHWWVKMTNILPVNTLRPPSGNNIVVGNKMQERYMSFGHLDLGDDEAYVVNLEPGGAKFRGLSLTNFWAHTLDIEKHISGYNVSQSAVNSDGTCTYVVSATDPGVENWLDTGGLRHTKLMHRWQMLPPREANSECPVWIEGNLFKLKDLDSVLPTDVRRVTPEERNQQLADRNKQYSLRYRVD